MFKIGDFSRLCHVPVKTLRYYDEIGLLHPEQVDRFTGYRYYSANQLPRLHRILALKDLGLTLDEIATLLDQGISPQELHGMLLRRKVQIRSQMQREQERLARVEQRLKMIEMEYKMPEYEVVIKQVPPLKVVSARGVMPTYSAQGPLWAKIERYMRLNHIQPAGPCFARYMDSEYKEKDIDIEACWSVNTSLEGYGDVTIQTLPAESVASLIHQGPFDTLHVAYPVLLQWIEKNGYRITGPEREIYVKTGEPVRQDDPSYVTEIQFPIAKAA